MAVEKNQFHRNDINKKTCKGNCCSLCCTKIENLKVVAGKNSILEDINIHIHCGELTAIVGPNGAGKSTLLKAILGEVRHGGNLSFVEASGAIIRKPRIGYVPQTPQFEAGCPVSVLDLFVSCISKYPVWLPIPHRMKERVKIALEKVEASHLMEKSIGVLSGGELRRILLALALEPIPELLLLDEPISGVDIKGMEMFYKTLDSIRNTYDLTVIIISHDMDIISKYADRILLLNKKIIKVGKPKEVFESSEFKTLFRLPYENSFLGGEKSGDVV